MVDIQTQQSTADGTSLPSIVKVGALSALGGLTYGGVSGILRASPHPVIHSISHSIHWAAFGSSFWWLRTNILHMHFQDNATPKQRAYTSAIAGGISGGVVTRVMGGKLIPGAVVFSMVGFLGQSSYNAIERWRQENEGRPSKSILQRMADSRWIPLRSLSDEEFRNILNEKLLAIEAEISILDEKIQELERERVSQSSNSRTSQSS
ncbi:hypothetical protein VTN49DRAFT_1321 [Thermomyces lanuginosus]|uniref:uncharacterized protein n=1 Tax=Thermomyces lanuginosus TaxID=5541 RepID=UPI0037444F4B